MKFAAASLNAKPNSSGPVRVVRRPCFLDDLSDAYAWIAPESEASAERLLRSVDLTIERLRRQPNIGARRDVLASGLFSIRARPFRHLIFYRIEGDRIILIRLLHGARMLEKQDYDD